MIRNRDSFRDAAWDWDALNEVLRPCKVSDLDGIVEKNGRFLVLEAKPRDKHEISVGQRILFDQLKAKGFTIVVLFGDAPKGPPIYWRVWGYHPAPVEPKPGEVIGYVRRWYAMACAAPRQVAA